MPSAVHAATRALSHARAHQGLADADDPALGLADVQAAYDVQHLMGAQLGWWPTGTPRCWKAGGPGRSMPLTYAPLPEAGVWAHPATAGDWPFLKARGIESEIALRLGRSVDAAQAAVLEPAGAAALVDAMAVAIELVDFRWQQGPAAPELLRLADLQCHAALVLGEWVAFDPAHDWAQQRCRTTIGGQAVVERQGTHSLGDPAWLLPQWLRHATARCGTLPAGTVVTTGSWVGLLQAQAGDRVDVDFAGIGQASVQL